jgi:hypothetical protein
MGRERGGNGKGEVSLGAAWGQGGQDRTTQEEGFQVSKRDARKEGIGKGNGKGKPARGITRDCAIT